MSGGLLAAAKAAKKSNSQISDSMIKATRQVVAFKNKSVSALKDFAKKSAAVTGAAVAGLATGFLALGDATEEFRAAQGRVSSAFSAAKLSAQDADAAFRGFYRILGDTDTAAEASQLLAQLTQNGEDVSSWLHIAAGVAGRFTDSIPTEGLIESMNETQKIGQVTGVFADALNWAGASEEKFNQQLEACSSESERNRLIMDTMLGLYNDAAHAFYANNDAMMDSREHSLDLQKSLSKLGDASTAAKNGILEMLGAQTGGGFREGSVFAVLTEQGERFAGWVQSADFSAFASKVDKGFAKGLGLAKSGFQWFMDNREPIQSALVGVGVALGAIKLVKFASDVVSAAKTLFNFGRTVGALVAANPVLAGIVAGISLLVLAGTALYKNWDTVKQTAAKVRDFFVSKFGPAIDKIKGAFDAVKDAVGGLISKVKDFLGLDTEKTVKVTTDYAGTHGHNALGTSYWRGGEIIDLPGGTRIIPHDVSEKMAGGRNVNVYVTVQGNVIGNKKYARELGEIVVEEILRAVDNT